MRMVVSLLLWLVLTASAIAQGCGPTNPNCIIPGLIGVPLTTAPNAAPLSLGNWNTFAGSFTGDNSKIDYGVKYNITGVATLGQPATGYLFTHELYPHVTYLFNQSGWNNSTSTNDGRTAAVAFDTFVNNAGQGDAIGYNCNAVVTGAKAGATNFLANPAVSCSVGTFTAGTAGTYLNPGEWALNDNGVDAAGIGWVVNLNRTVNTGALGVTWGGYTAQSTGSAATDWFLRATGPWNLGIDFTQANFGANQAAAALLANQKIYLNATSTGAFTFSPGGTYAEYQSANTCAHFVVNGSVNECFDALGHVRVQNLAPALTACGTTPAISGSDIAGLVTMGTGAPTGCVITFSAAYLNAPYCTVTWQTNIASMQYTISNTAITLTQTATSSNKVNYECRAQAGG